MTTGAASGLNREEGGASEGLETALEYEIADFYADRQLLALDSGGAFMPSADEEPIEPLTDADIKVITDDCAAYTEAQKTDTLTDDEELRILLFCTDFNVAVTMAKNPLTADTSTDTDSITDIEIHDRLNFNPLNYVIGEALFSGLQTPKQLWSSTAGPDQLLTRLNIMSKALVISAAGPLAAIAPAMHEFKYRNIQGKIVEWTGTPTEHFEVLDKRKIRFEQDHASRNNRKIDLEAIPEANRSLAQKTELNTLKGPQGQDFDDLTKLRTQNADLAQKSQLETKKALNAQYEERMKVLNSMTDTPDVQAQKDSLNSAKPAAFTEEDGVNLEKVKSKTPLTSDEKIKLADLESRQSKSAIGAKERVDNLKKTMVDMTADGTNKKFTARKDIFDLENQIRVDETLQKTELKELKAAEAELEKVNKDLEEMKKNKPTDDGHDGSKAKKPPATADNDETTTRKNALEAKKAELNKKINGAGLTEDGIPINPDEPGLKAKTEQRKLLDKSNKEKLTGARTNYETEYKNKPPSGEESFKTRVKNKIAKKWGNFKNWGKTNFGSLKGFGTLIKRTSLRFASFVSRTVKAIPGAIKGATVAVAKNYKTNWSKQGMKAQGSMGVTAIGGAMIVAYGQDGDVKQAAKDTVIESPQGVSSGMNGIHSTAAGFCSGNWDEALKNCTHLAAGMAKGILDMANGLGKLMCEGSKILKTGKTLSSGLSTGICTLTGWTKTITGGLKTAIDFTEKNILNPVADVTDDIVGWWLVDPGDMVENYYVKKP